MLSQHGICKFFKGNVTTVRETSNHVANHAIDFSSTDVHANVSLPNMVNDDDVSFISRFRLVSAC